MHFTCLVDIGEIQVHGLMVRHKSCFYYLPDSFPINNIFPRMRKIRFLHVEDMIIYRQDRSCEPAALMAVNPNSKSVSQSNVNDCTKESNHLNLNSEAFRRIISYQMSGGECFWLYEDKKGMKRGPHSISELISWLHHGTICGSDSKSNGVGDVMNLNCEISEDLSCQ